MLHVTKSALVGPGPIVQHSLSQVSTVTMTSDRNFGGLVCQNNLT